jgi:hypothetical protein
MVDDWPIGEEREFRWQHPDLAPPEGFVENGEPPCHQHIAEDGAPRNRLVVKRIAP